MTSCVALIPARAGSVRVPRKNIRELGGKPLVLWTIEAAHAAGLDDVFVSSDSVEIGALATENAAVWIRRPAAYATATSPDIEWVRHAIAWMRARGNRPDILAILRPTSPFRDASVIQGALDRFLRLEPLTSMRAMRLAKEHPAKAWLGTPGETLMKPAYEDARWREVSPAPMHSSQTNTLPPAYVQTAGLELVRRATVEKTGLLAGEHVAGYLLDGAAALDINTEEDWARAAALVLNHPELL